MILFFLDESSAVAKKSKKVLLYSGKAVEGRALNIKRAIKFVRTARQSGVKQELSNKRLIATSVRLRMNFC